MVHYEHAVSRKITFGLLPVYYNNFSSSQPTQAFGGFATLAYSFGRAPFEGIFASLGPGVYALSGSSKVRSTNATAAAAFIDVGWRGSIGGDFGLSLSAGAQYVDHSSAVDQIAFGGWLPWFSGELGYRF
jgi:hypothetical protein